MQLEIIGLGEFKLKQGSFSNFARLGLALALNASHLSLTDDGVWDADSTSHSTSVDPAPTVNADPPEVLVQVWDKRDFDYRVYLREHGIWESTNVVVKVPPAKVQAKAAATPAPAIVLAPTPMPLPQPSLIDPALIPVPQPIQLDTSVALAPSPLPPIYIPTYSPITLPAPLLVPSASIYTNNAPTPSVIAPPSLSVEPAPLPKRAASTQVTALKLDPIEIPVLSNLTPPSPFPNSYPLAVKPAPTDPGATPSPVAKHVALSASVNPAPASQADTFSALDRILTPQAGARKVMATLYQSCSAVQLPPLPGNKTENGKAFTLATHGLHLGRFTNGGTPRYITDAHAYALANPYLSALPKTPEPGCIDVRKNPSFFNYGAKPAVVAGKVPEIDVLKNQFSRTPAATTGFDCSGFVTASFLAAGYRITPSATAKKPFTAGEVQNALATKNTWTYINPQGRGGASCFEKVKVSSKNSIRAGDVIVWNTHMVMIDSVGKDPFGIDRAKKPSDCESAPPLNANMIDPRKFNFKIIQSSNNYGGIGVNVMQASNAFSRANSSSSTSAAIRDFAKDACLAKFGISTVASESVTTTTRYKSGKKSVNRNYFSIVRHKDTPECMAAAPVPLKHEACIDSCKEIYQ